MMNIETCPICKRAYKTNKYYWGNSAWPILSQFEFVCKECNERFVIPARIGKFSDDEELNYEVDNFVNGLTEEQKNEILEK